MIVSESQVQTLNTGALGETFFDTGGKPQGTFPRLSRFLSTEFQWRITLQTSLPFVTLQTQGTALHPQSLQ